MTLTLTSNHGVSRPVVTKARRSWSAARKYRFFRFIFVSSALLLLAVALLVALLNPQSAIATVEEPYQHSYYTIYSGDTLWGLASQFAPEADPWEFIYEVSKLNQLDGLALQAGDQIAIPQQYARS